MIAQFTKRDMANATVVTKLQPQGSERKKCSFEFQFEALTALGMRFDERQPNDMHKRMN